MAVNQIENQEGGGEVREKLNQTIDNANDVSNRMQKIPTAVDGNVAVFLNGQVIDSGQTPGGGTATNIPTWESLQNTPIPLDFVVRFDGRLFASRVADNLGNQPPVGGGQNTFWREVSQSEATSTPIYAPGIFDIERARVFRLESNQLVEYVLRVAANEIPFESTNFATELAAGQWQQLGGTILTSVITRQRGILIVNSNNIDIDFDSKNEFKANNRLIVSANATIDLLNIDNADFCTFKVEIQSSATLTFNNPGSYTFVSESGGNVLNMGNGKYTISLYITGTEIEILNSAPVS